MNTLQYRIFDKVSKEMIYSGRTPKMLASFFDSTAILHTVGKDKYMQSTGLTDVNGQEIFVGDIVEAHNFYFNGNFDNDYESEYQVVSITMIKDLIGIGEHGELGRYIEFCDTSHDEEPCIKIIGNIFDDAMISRYNDIGFDDIE